MTELQVLVNEIEKKMVEIADFLKNHKTKQNVSYCGREDHEGLTYWCIYGGKNCVTCLACEVESIIYDRGKICGSFLINSYGDLIHVKNLTKNERESIPHLSNDELKKFRTLLNELRYYMAKFHTFLRDKIIE